MLLPIVSLTNVDYHICTGFCWFKRKKKKKKKTLLLVTSECKFVLQAMRRPERHTSIRDLLLIASFRNYVLFVPVSYCSVIEWKTRTAFVEETICQWRRCLSMLGLVCRTRDGALRGSCRVRQLRRVCVFFFFFLSHFIWIFSPLKD